MQAQRVIGGAIGADSGAGSAAVASRQARAGMAPRRGARHAQALTGLAGLASGAVPRLLGRMGLVGLVGLVIALAWARPAGWWSAPAPVQTLAQFAAPSLAQTAAPLTLPLTLPPTVPQSAPLTAQTAANTAAPLTPPSPPDATPVPAATPAPTDAAAGTLAGLPLPLRIGVQRSAMPFAFARDGSFHGYSVDLCLQILGRLLGREALRAGEDYRFVPVSPRSRLLQLLSHEVDLECGSTSRTAARQQLGLAFSRTIFVSDVAVLLPPAMVAQSATLIDWVNTTRDRNLSAVTTSGSTSVRHLRDLVGPQGQPLRKRLGQDHDDALRQLRQDRHASGFVMDRALLAARLAQDERLQRAGYRLSDWAINPGAPECYGLVMRANDLALVAGVERELQALRSSGALRRLYARWFEQPLDADRRLPDTQPGRALGIQASAELSRVLISDDYDACR